jgi:hypothetical protein
VIVLAYSNIIRLIRCAPPARIRRVIELNLNRKNFMFQVTPKNKEIKLFVTKDLRLNFKLGLLSRIFPSAKYLIAIRNPGAQISSILRLMDKGNLGELKQSLLSLPEYLGTNARFEKYLPLIDRQYWGKDIQEMLIIWWLVNYDTLISDCQKFNVDYKIIYHEDISENLQNVSREIFDFIELDYSANVQSYLTESSTKGREIKSPLDTVRDTSRYYKERINQVDPLLMARIKMYLDSISLVDALERYKI